MFSLKPKMGYSTTDSVTLRQIPYSFFAGFDHFTIGHASPSKRTKHMRGGGCFLAQTPTGLTDPSIQQIHRSINRSIDPSTDPSIHQQIHRSINRSIDPSTDPSIHQQIHRSINRSIDPSTDPSIHQQIHRSNRSIDPSMGRWIDRLGGGGGILILLICLSLNSRMG